jgi:phosphatidate phosphatase APP1
VIRTPWQEVEVNQMTEIMVLPDQIQAGVISDIDDTILRTELKSLFKWRALYLTFLKNAAGRQSFHKGAAFYQTLKKGLDGEGKTPFFYVSKSPWNLYDVLVDFIKMNKLPVGPVLLRDIGLPHEKRSKAYLGHKHEQIQHIMNTFPNIRFVLIGDTVEADASIYLKITRQYPGRISAIYLRDINSRKKRKKLMSLLGKNSLELPICIFKSFEEAEAHAQKSILR